jgi:hypothetical protein
MSATSSVVSGGSAEASSRFTGVTRRASSIIVLEAR